MATLPRKDKNYILEWQRQNPGRCSAAQIRYRKNSPIKYLITLGKRRAKRKGIEFSIEENDLYLPETCPLLGIEINQYSSNMDNHASLDRIDNSKGYIKGNVMIISHRANRLKNDATSDELRLLAENLAKYEKVI